jgi:hypothetical protein
MLDRILGALGRLLNRLDPPAGRHHDDLTVQATIWHPAGDAATTATVYDDGPVSRPYTDTRWLAAGRGRTAARDIAAAIEAAATGWHQAAYRATFA